MKSFQQPILWDASFQIPVTAGHVFATLTPPAGYYHVHIDRVAYGSGSPSIANNARFNVGSTAYVLATAAALDINYDFDFYVRLDGSTTISVTAAADGSPAIGVTVGMSAVRIG